jgi:hypothetical protein
MRGATVALCALILMCAPAQAQEPVGAGPCTVTVTRADDGAGAYREDRSVDCPLGPVACRADTVDQGGGAYQQRRKAGCYTPDVDCEVESVDVNFGTAILVSRHAGCGTPVGKVGCHEHQSETWHYRYCGVGDAIKLPF